MGKNMNEKLWLAMKTLHDIKNDPSQAEVIINAVMNDLEAMEEPTYKDDKIILPHLFSAKLCFNMGWMEGGFAVLNSSGQHCDGAWKESVASHLYKSNSDSDAFDEAVNALAPFATLAKKYRQHIANSTVQGSTLYDRQASETMIKEEAMENLYESLVSHDVDVFYKAEAAIGSILAHTRKVDIQPEKETVSWRVRCQLTDGSWGEWCLATEYPEKTYSNRQIEIQALGVISQKSIAPKKEAE